MKTKNLRKNVMLLAPLFGLVALLVAFFIIGTSKNINVAYGMKSIINQSVVVAVVATGAIFIYTLGSFDISLGASVAVSALVGGIVYNKTESLVIMFAGKFSASIGPIFIATYRAVLGSPIRTEDGNALALSQGYWVATSPEEFSEYYAVDSSVDSPAYTKGMLDGLLTADYASFEKFVSAYGFKDIQEEAK